MTRRLSAQEAFLLTAIMLGINACQMPTLPSDSNQDSTSGANDEKKDNQGKSAHALPQTAINASILSPSLAIMGPQASDNMPFGSRLAFVNVTSDGYSDLAVFSPHYLSGRIDPNQSDVNVYSGKDQSLLFTLTGNFSFGRSIASAGNFNHDGADAIVIGAPSCTACGGVGSFYVYSGKSHSLIYSKTGGANSLLGWIVAGAGDVDGDGYDDVLVTDPSYASGRGIAYVISGLTHSIIFSATGENQGDYLGMSATGLGDIDGDGFPDIAIGTRDYQSQISGTQLTGKIYAYSPRSNQLLWTKTGLAFEGLGIGLAQAGDFNADGIPDVLAMAGISNQLYVLSGLDGSTLYHQENVQSYFYGLNMATLGDIEGNGHSDFAVGNNLTGTVDVISGKKRAVIATISANPSDLGSPGAFIIGGNNFNGDLKSNLAIAVINAHQTNSDGNPRGKFYVISPEELIKSKK